MLCHGQRNFDSLAGFETTLDEREIGLPNPMLTERATQSLPELLVRREGERTRRLDIESMNHTRAQSAFAHPEDLGMSRDDGVQHGVVLIRSKRMDPAARRLVDDQPAAALGQYLEGQVRARNRALVGRQNRSVDLEDLAEHRRMRFISKAESPPGTPNTANLEQMTHSRPRDRQLIGQEPIETLTLAALAYFDAR